MNPEFITIVWGSLHTLMSEEHDDELMLDGHVHGDKNIQDMNLKKRDRIK